MSESEDIEAQSELLRIYRRNLARYMQQEASQGGAAYVTPVVANGIIEARAAIARIKEALRGSGQIVDDLSDDTPQIEQAQASVVAPSAGSRYEIRDFSAYIRERTADFVGRAFVFKAIDSFVQSNPRGYFIIYGDPGIGKSAIASKLVETGKYIHHFNIRGESSSRGILVQNLCAQIDARFGFISPSSAPTKELEHGYDGYRLRQHLEEAARTLGSGQRLVLVVDALDELLNEAAPQVALPPLPALLPHGVYVIVTSRRDPEGIFRIECEYDLLDIAQDLPAHLDDVRALILRSANQAGIQNYIQKQRGTIDVNWFVDSLVELSQGNFMYLRHVLPEIEKGAYTDVALRNLPIGLRNYYQDHWRRMRKQSGDDWKKSKLPVIVALTVVREPISITRIAEFSGLNDVSLVYEVLREWVEFLYMTESPYQGATQRRYRLYHASFQDFVASNEEVDLVVAHRRVANAMRDALDELERE